MLKVFYQQQDAKVRKNLPESIFCNFLILHVDSNSSALPFSFHSFQGIARLSRFPSFAKSR